MSYTKWWIAHPWHVSGWEAGQRLPVDCDCGCSLRAGQRYWQPGQKLKPRVCPPIGRTA
jgi:hypothetical protein